MQLTRFLGGDVGRKRGSGCPGTHKSGKRGGREIAACWTPHPADIAIDHHACRTSVAKPWLDKGVYGHFRGEIGSHLGIEQRRGAEVWDVEGFHPMLPLATRLRGVCWLLRTSVQKKREMCQEHHEGTTLSCWIPESSPEKPTNCATRLLKSYSLIS